MSDSQDSRELRDLIVVSFLLTAALIVAVTVMLVAFLAKGFGWL